MTHSHTPTKCKKVLLSSIFRFNVTVFNFDSRTLATSRIFWSKINIFLIYVPKDSPCSCDYFHTNFLVVGSHLRRRNPENIRKNANSHICVVASSITSALWIIYHLKELDLMCDNFGRLSAATTWWRSGAKWAKNLKWLWFDREFSESIVD